MQTLPQLLDRLEQAIKASSLKGLKTVETNDLDLREIHEALSKINLMLTQPLEKPTLIENLITQLIEKIKYLLITSTKLSLVEKKLFIQIKASLQQRLLLIHDILSPKDNRVFIAWLNQLIKTDTLSQQDQDNILQHIQTDFNFFKNTSKEVENILEGKQKFMNWILEIHYNIQSFLDLAGDNASLMTIHGLDMHIKRYHDKNEFQLSLTQFLRHYLSSYLQCKFSNQVDLFFHAHPYTGCIEEQIERFSIQLSFLAPCNPQDLKKFQQIFSRPAENLMQNKPNHDYFLQKIIHPSKAAHLSDRKSQLFQIKNYIYQKFPGIELDENQIISFIHHYLNLAYGIHDPEEDQNLTWLFFPEQFSDFFKVPGYHPQNVWQQLQTITLTLPEIKELKTHYQEHLEKTYPFMTPLLHSVTLKNYKFSSTKFFNADIDHCFDRWIDLSTPIYQRQSLKLYHRYHHVRKIKHYILPTITLLSFILTVFLLLQLIMSVYLKHNDNDKFMSWPFMIKNYPSRLAVQISILAGLIIFAPLIKLFMHIYTFYLKEPLVKQFDQIYTQEQQVLTALDMLYQKTTLEVDKYLLYTLIETLKIRDYTEALEQLSVLMDKPSIVQLIQKLSRKETHLPILDDETQPLLNNASTLMLYQLKSNLKNSNRPINTQHVPNNTVKSWGCC